jgi:uracil-DNA glycosylase
MINSQKHLVLYNVHPSPLAGQGFVTIKDFSKANTYLKQMGKEPIDWNVD